MVKNLAFFFYEQIKHLQKEKPESCFNSPALWCVPPALSYRVTLPAKAERLSFQKAI